MTTTLRRARPMFALLAAAVLAACGGGEQGGEPPKPAVTVATLQTRPVTITRELPGRTNAWLVAEVRPQVSGIVARRLFTEGGMVKAGEPLYQIDDASYRALPPDMATPSLTTVHSPIRAAGAQVAAMALEAVAGTGPAERTQIWTASLVQRGSTAPPPA